MQRRVLRLLAEHHPFYLLSALCMLAGCYTLSHVLALEPGEIGKLLVLLATLSVYEALLIGFALFLLLRRRLERDGRILLVIEALFLADATFLSGEGFTHNLVTGMQVSCAVLSLALLKIVVVFRALEPQRPSRALLPVTIPLVLIFATRGVLALLAARQVLTPAVLYALWWVASLAVLLQMLLDRNANEAVPELWRPSADSFRRVLVLGLPVSLALHLASSAWVYGVPFYMAYLGPILIAAGAIAILCDLPSFSLRWRMVLPAAGIVVSGGYAGALLVHGPWDLMISPFRVAMLAAGLAYLLGYHLQDDRVFAWGAVVCLMGAVAGHSPAAIAQQISKLWRWTRDALRWLVPETAARWGILSIVMAFILLAIGGLVSLFTGRESAESRR